MISITIEWQGVVFKIQLKQVVPKNLHTKFYHGTRSNRTFKFLVQIQYQSTTEKDGAANQQSVHISAVLYSLYISNGFELRYSLICVINVTNIIVTNIIVTSIIVTNLPR